MSRFISPKKKPHPKRRHSFNPHKKRLFRKSHHAPSRDVASHDSELSLLVSEGLSIYPHSLRRMKQNPAPLETGPIPSYWGMLAEENSSESPPASPLVFETPRYLPKEDLPPPAIFPPVLPAILPPVLLPSSETPLETPLEPAKKTLEVSEKVPELKQIQRRKREREPQERREGASSPAFSSQSENGLLSPRHMSLAVLIPVYNEVRTIGLLLERIEAQRKKGIHLDIFVVDDCSTDGTSELLETYAKEGRIVLKRQAVNQGKGAALRACIESIGSQEFALIQDADLEYDPDDYLALLKPLQEGRADVVYGSRFIGASERRILNFWHSMANKILTLFSNMLTDMHLTDMETCYKCFRTDFLKDLFLESNRFGIEPELTAKIKKMCAVVYEVPIRYHGRNYIEGKKIGWRDGVAAFYHMLRFHYTKRFCREPDFERLYRLFQKKRFTHYLYEQISPHLGERILELGTGLGGLAELLCNRHALFLSDHNECFLRFLQRKFRGVPTVEVLRLDAEKDSLSPLHHQIDTVLMVNLLEHLERDEFPLNAAYPALPFGGRVVLVVPLNRTLTCDLDRNLGRLGRYDAQELKEMVERAGFHLESFQEISRLGTLLWWFFGKVLGKTSFSGLALTLYSLLTPLIRLWDILIPWPRGLTGIAVAIKKK